MRQQLPEPAPRRFAELGIVRVDQSRKHGTLGQGRTPVIDVGAEVVGTLFAHDSAAMQCRIDAAVAAVRSAYFQMPRASQAIWGLPALAVRSVAQSNLSA